MKPTETIVGAAGKATRYGGFAAGIQLLIEAASQDPTNWGRIVSGSIVCVVCIIWSYAHDKKISE